MTVRFERVRERERETKNSTGKGKGPRTGTKKSKRAEQKAKRCFFFVEGSLIDNKYKKT